MKRALVCSSSRHQDFLPLHRALLILLWRRELILTLLTLLERTENNVERLFYLVCM